MNLDNRFALSYPETRRVEAEEVLSGVSFQDPYRWLEDGTDEVRAWQRRQAAIASAYVRRWPKFDSLGAQVRTFLMASNVSVPRYAAGRWFRFRMEKDRPVVVVSKTPMGDGQIVFAPADSQSGHAPFISWLAPSPDGRVLAAGVCTDGSEKNRISLIDVASGRSLPDSPQATIMDNFTGGVQWLKDSSGFFFSTVSGVAKEFDQRIYLHRRIQYPTTEWLDIPWLAPNAYRMVTVSRDGRYATAIERIANPVPVAIAELGYTNLHWRPFVTAITGTVAGHVIANEYYAVTDVGAPRGRLIAIPIDSRDPNDASTWREVCPESDGVIRTMVPVNDTLYLTELVDSYARVRIVGFNGAHLGQVPLPGKGAIGEAGLPMMNLTVTPHPSRYVFSFSSLTESPGIYSHRPGDDAIEVWQSPAVRLDNARVEDASAVSTDGVKVPFHIVALQTETNRQPRPTLIFAYGGFNVAFVPEFPGAMAAFVAAGGILVLAHLRGGGEFGADWYHAGRKQNAQRSYDDLYAVAEQLINDGYCTSQTLAVTGRSHGGLMAAVAATQRPELWAVAIPQVPSLDQIGACRYVYGRRAVLGERADIKDPEEVRRLATFSPYHLVRPGVRYPAVYIVAGDTDPRCPAWHSRKFAARLQNDAPASRPVLLHVWEDSGHGAATDVNTRVWESTEWLAFVFQLLDEATYEG